MRLTTVPVTEGFPDMELLNALDREAFPPAEYVPVARLVEMSKKDGVDLWAFYDAEAFVGFMFVIASQTMAYLFFLAIDASRRSRGYGGKALDEFSALYPGRQLVVDLEMQDAAADNAQQRKIRRAFYLRNGFLPTGRFFLYFGVPVEVLCKSEGFDFAAFQSLLGEVELTGFDPVFFTP